MKKLFILTALFISAITISVGAQNSIQIKMEEIQEQPLLSIDKNGNITNIAKPMFATGEIKDIDLTQFKDYKKEIKFVEEFVSQPEDDKMIMYIVAINEKNEINYLKEDAIQKEIKGTTLSIKLLKIPIDVKNIKIVLLEKYQYKIIPIELTYKKDKAKANEQKDKMPYEYNPTMFITH
mgnify:FL=1